MEHAVAAEIVVAMRKYYRTIEETVGLVRRTCSPEEFVQYRQAVAQILGNITVDVLMQIYKEHPDLAPPDDGGSG